MRKENNWYVITGGPGSGKTTTVNLLESLGYKTTVEKARHYIDTKLKDGKTIEEIESNQRGFQQAVMSMQLKAEQHLNPAELVFMDRAIPDALAYYKFLNLKPDAFVEQAIKNASYKKVFILDCLPMVNDYARHEDEKAQHRIHELIVEVYEALPFPIVYVPVLAAQERVNLILKNL